MDISITSKTTFGSRRPTIEQRLAATSREVLARFHFQPAWKESIIGWKISIAGTVDTDLERALSHALPLMIQTVKRMLSRSTQEYVTECRNCGANVEPETDSCPLCGSDEIAYYEIGP